MIRHPRPFLSLISRVVAPTPCFPGAQGWGTETIGGRGGKVYFVTQTGDPRDGVSPALGAWRTAAEASEPRMVLFKVSGTINNVEPVVINHPFMTAAGQTAPGDGVCISGEETRVQASDVVLRHMRFRRGDVQDARDGFQNADALNIGSPNAVGKIQRVVVDHCSLSWSIDEILDVLFRAHDITISRCCMGEALYRSRHPDGPHSMGPDILAKCHRISIHHNYLAHCNQRNFQYAGDNVQDYRNNHVYNFGEHASEFKNPDHRVNFVSNSYTWGPNSKGILLPGPTTITGIIAVDNTDIGMQIYAVGNMDPRLGEASIDIDNWPIIQVAGDGSQIPDEFRAGHWLGSPIEAPFVTTLRANLSLIDVLSDCGATKPKRDSVDARMIQDFFDGTGAIIDSQAQVGGWPTLNSVDPPLDSDGDGIPDEWENAHGLNAFGAADANRIERGQPYTWLERYVNSLAGDPGT